MKMLIHHVITMCCLSLALLRQRSWHQEGAAERWHQQVEELRGVLRRAACQRLHEDLPQQVPRPESLGKSSKSGRNVASLTAFEAQEVGARTKAALRAARRTLRQLHVSRTGAQVLQPGRCLERLQAVRHAAHARRAHHAHIAQAVPDLRQHLPQLVQEGEAVARGAQAP